MLVRAALVVWSVSSLALVPAGAAFAVTDPLAAVENLSTFIFGLIRAIGLILLGFGVVQVGLSLKSHDPSQRANGFLTLAGGVIITFAKEILDLIVGWSGQDFLDNYLRIFRLLRALSRKEHCSQWRNASSVCCSRARCT